MELNGFPKIKFLLWISGLLSQKFFHDAVDYNQATPATGSGMSLLLNIGRGLRSFF